MNQIKKNVLKVIPYFASVLCTWERFKDQVYNLEEESLGFRNLKYRVWSDSNNFAINKLLEVKQNILFKSLLDPSLKNRYWGETSYKPHKSSLQ